MRPTDKNIMIFSAIVMTFGTAVQVMTAGTQLGVNINVLAVVLSSAAIGAMVPMLMIFKAKAEMNETSKSCKLFPWIPAFWVGSLPAGMITTLVTGDIEAGWLVFLALCAWAPALAFSFLLINCLPTPNRGI